MKSFLTTFAAVLCAGLVLLFISRELDKRDQEQKQIAEVNAAYARAAQTTGMKEAVEVEPQQSEAERLRKQTLADDGTKLTKIDAIKEGLPVYRDGKLIGPIHRVVGGDTGYVLVKNGTDDMKMIAAELLKSDYQTSAAGPGTSTQP